MNNKFMKHAECTHPKKDCAACHEGKCVALYDTHFEGKDCPFYMDKKTSAERIIECSARLLKKGYPRRRVG